MIIIILCTQQCYYYELFENLMIIKTMDLKFNFISFFSVYNNNNNNNNDYCDGIYIVNNYYFYYPNPLLQHKCNG